MKSKSLITYGVIGIVAYVFASIIFSGGGDVNAIESPYFTADGRLVSEFDAFTDSSKKHIPRSYLKEKQASNVKFYIEVSGSMNGFFRANLPTGFKRDVWSVFSNFRDWTDCVNVLSNEGKIQGHLKLDDFRGMMNAGAFVSAAETKVPVMLETVLNDLDFVNGEIGVIVSDMKFSPERAKDMGVQITQYPSDIRNIVSKSGASFCLIAATSNYLDKTGCEIADKSPYYYFIIGDSESVIWARNCICTLLEHNSSYVDELEWNIDYKSVCHDFGSPIGAIRLPNEPTFYDLAFFPCDIPISIDITSYRWILANEECFKNAIKVYIDSITGTNAEIIDIKITDDHQHGKMLERKATANFTLRVSEMCNDADVIEWTLEQPETLTNGEFSSFFGAQSEQQYDKTFLIEKFIDGMNKGTKNLWDEEPNRILISKNS